MLKGNRSVTGAVNPMRRRNAPPPGRAAQRVGIAVAALLLVGAIPVYPQGHDAQVDEIIRNPTVVYQKAFDVDTTLELWNRVLDNLYLMGRLWEVYRFQPAYRVTRTESGLHVVDPTGIVGNVRQVARSHLSRRFLGRGSFNHWAVPSFCAADGVILFDCTADQDRLRGEVKIFMQGENWLSRFAMQLFSGVLSRRIDNRFANNMADTKKIIADIAGDPDKVRNSLTGSLRDDFDRAFPPGGPNRQWNDPIGQP